MKLPAVSRINAFDLLRGWCLVVITSDHLMRFPSLFDPVTGRGLMWVTAAEGFFFISGALVGIVRGRKMHNEGLGQALKLVWKRAAKLYVASIILTVAFSGLAYWLLAQGVHDVKGGVEYFHSPLELIWNTVILKYTYGWSDFLNFYVVFLLLSPVALWLCRKRLWWVILAVSLVLWVTKSWVGGTLEEGFLTWQSYFFIGLVFGYHYGHIHAWYRSLTESTRRLGHRFVYAVTAITILASFVLTFGTPVFEAWWGAQAVATTIVRDIKDNSTFTFLFQENRTGLLRLVMFLLWFGTLFALVRRYESAIIDKIGWLLLPLGKNSLYVYILQGVIAMAVAAIGFPQQFVLNTLINMAVIMILWVAVKKRFLFAVIPR